MYVFGGILELTKEVNDMLSLDLNSHKFSSHQEPINEEYGGMNRGIQDELASPGQKKRATMTNPKGL